MRALHVARDRTNKRTHKHTLFVLSRRTQHTSKGQVAHDGETISVLGKEKKKNYYPLSLTKKKKVKMENERKDACDVIHFQGVAYVTRYISLVKKNKHTGMRIIIQNIN